MEIKHNIFLKYEAYFKQYPFIGNFELKCKILIREHITDGRYDYFGERVETMRHGTYGIMLSISKDRVLTIYEGSWGSDTYHGKGNLYILSHPQSDKQTLRLFQGQWRNGTLHGSGTIKVYDSKTQAWKLNFQGHFKDGEKSGFGIQKDGQNTYRGEFSMGCRTGKGRLQDGEGNFFDGIYEKGFLVGQSYESVGDTFIITDENCNKKVYRKPENTEQFTLNFSKLIHQIVSLKN